uniref:Glycopeptide n=1 Tax=Oryza sativa subsp. japonica TaxID=39947 RepID=Q8LNQ4_ORYSJ|nr:putative glycopeptide [Oryza sativa Japonica Group]
MASKKRATISTLSSRGSAAGHGRSAASASTIRGGARGLATERQWHVAAKKGKEAATPAATSNAVKGAATPASTSAVGKQAATPATSVAGKKTTTPVTSVASKAVAMVPLPGIVAGPPDGQKSAAMKHIHQSAAASMRPHIHQREPRTSAGEDSATAADSAASTSARRAGHRSRAYAAARRSLLCPLPPPATRRGLSIAREERGER